MIVVGRPAGLATAVERAHEAAEAPTDSQVGKHRQTKAAARTHQGDHLSCCRRGRRWPLMSCGRKCAQTRTVTNAVMEGLAACDCFAGLAHERVYFGRPLLLLAVVARTNARVRYTRRGRLPPPRSTLAPAKARRVTARTTRPTSQPVSMLSICERCDCCMSTIERRRTRSAATVLAENCRLAWSARESFELLRQTNTTAARSLARPLVAKSSYESHACRFVIPLGKPPPLLFGSRTIASSTPLGRADAVSAALGFLWATSRTRASSPSRASEFPALPLRLPPSRLRRARSTRTRAGRRPVWHTMCVARATGHRHHRRGRGGSFGSAGRTCAGGRPACRLAAVPGLLAGTVLDD
jgi:hypothetical protein